MCKKRTGSLRVMVPPGAGSGLIRARKTRSCRGRPEERTGSLRVLVPPGAGFRVYGLEKRMRAGVRLGGPEKRTGSLRVVIPPGAGRARKMHACRSAFRGARKTHRLPSRCDSTRSRVQGLRARKTYAWTMEKCILPLAFKQLDCVISGTCGLRTQVFRTRVQNAGTCGPKELRLLLMI